MIVALWYTVLVSPPKSQGRPSYPFPQLAPPIAHGYEDPSEVIGMMRGRKVELNEGYHKRAYVYLGKLAVLITFDTGSFRNAIQLDFLKELEAKQSSGQLGAQVVAPRAACAKHNVLGATTAMTGSFDEVVDMRVTFRGSDGRSAMAVITSVVMHELSAPMLLGCPTLDKLMFAMTGEAVEPRAYDLELPAVLPSSQGSGDNIAILRESVMIHPEKVRELWVLT